MKKNLLLPVLLAWAASLAFGASLTLVQPNGSEQMSLGTTFQIKWIAVDINNKIMLVLFKGGTKLGTIAQDLNATPAAYSWPVGKYEGTFAPEGNDYKIRVRTMTDGADDISEATFTIKAAAPGTGNAINGNLAKIEKKTGQQRKP